MKRFCLLLLLATLTIAAFAQNYVDIQMGGIRILRIRTDGGYPNIQARADAIYNELAVILGMSSLKPLDFTIRDDKKLKDVRCIYVRNRLLVKVTPADAKVAKTTVNKLALDWRAQLQKKLPQLNAQPARRAPQK